MYCLIYDPDKGSYLEFKKPVSVFQTNDVSRVKECLKKALDYSGKQIVGFISYEASPAFDDAFTVHSLPGEPLICFGVFDSFDAITPAVSRQKPEFSTWFPSVNDKEYNKTITRIKHHIAEGDTYQVNYTFKLTSRFTGDPRQLFFQVQQQVQAEYAAYIELETHTILSFSPELFFTWDKGILTSKPMKGTAPRGLTTAEDKGLGQELARSGKNQAENVMIVDMIRNDMGRVAKPGSVNVASLFDVTRYPYVLQMTSTVESQADVPLFEVINALFPCASITGAPKYRTMKIINDLESKPRGVYTGTIGHITPEGKARFNVAIRTLLLDKKTGVVEYGVGSGIVWDSEAESEYRECLVKADFLKRQESNFQLLESLLWTENDGYYLLENHLERLADSAEYFDYVCPLVKIREYLEEFQTTIPLSSAKIRLLLNKDGQFKLEWGILSDTKSSNLRVALADKPVNSSNRFLYHKTTNRNVYEDALMNRPDCDDVILWNEKGEVTESSRSNLVAEINGELVTPPVSSGLLAGTFRRYLLEKGEIREKSILVTDIKKASGICLINSVRTWMDATLI